MLPAFPISILRTLRHHGHQAYLAGGCVRDLLLDREPADYDVATSATPDEVMRIFPETYAVGAQFGVVLVPDSSVPPVSSVVKDFSVTASHPGLIEVATFRADVSYSDGRHPDEVRYTLDPREDVQRRDFTINGMMLDPLLNQLDIYKSDINEKDIIQAGLLDYVGGQADLKAGIIRAIGDPIRRFTEDKLRMLRAVRFAARFGYAIEPATFSAIRNLAAQIHQVSRERVRDELTRMLTEGHAREAFLLLDFTGLLHQVLPEIEKMKGVAQPPEYHPEGDAFIHALLLLEKLSVPVSSTLAWGALLHDVGKPPTFRVAPDRIRFDGHVEIGEKMAEAILRRLRFSNDDIDQILALVANHMRFGQVREMKDSTFKRFIRLPQFDEHLELHRLDCQASHRHLDLYDFTREKIASLPSEAIRPQPLLTGDDLIAAGYPPGPRFKEILSTVEDAQLEGRLDSRSSALAFVLEIFPL